MQNRVGRADFFLSSSSFFFFNIHFPVLQQNDKPTQLQCWKAPLFSTFNVFLLLFRVFCCLFVFVLFFFYIVAAWVKTTEPAAGSCSIMLGYSRPSCPLPSYYYVDSDGSSSFFFAKLVLIFYFCYFFLFPPPLFFSFSFFFPWPFSSFFFFFFFLKYLW